MDLHDVLKHADLEANGRAKSSGEDRRCQRPYSTKKIYKAMSNVASCSLQLVYASSALCVPT